MLNPLPLGRWEYHRSVSSTNDLAAARAAEGAPDWTLVVADEQTQGRGRAGRRWITQPGVGLAFSLALLPQPQELKYAARFTALAALGLIRALQTEGLAPLIKWPNDILLRGKKVAGVLVESSWQGEQLTALVVGLGVNVSAESIPPMDKLRYPATAVEVELGKPINRWTLLAKTLQAMFEIRTVLPKSGFMDMWNEYLAFRGERVNLVSSDGTHQRGEVVRIDKAGRLVLALPEGEIQAFPTGEIEISYN